MHSFAGLIRLTPPRRRSVTLQSPTATLISLFSSSELTGCGSEKSFGHVPPVGVELSTSCVQGEHPIHWARLSASADNLPSGTSVNIAHDITTSGLFPFNGRVYNANNHRNRGVNNAKLKVHCSNMVSCATPLVVYFPPLLGEPPTILSWSGATVF